MIETWLPVVGYEGLYSISDQGQVRDAVAAANVSAIAVNLAVHISTEARSNVHEAIATPKKTHIDARMAVEHVAHVLANPRIYN